MQTTRIISEADIVPNRSAGYRLVKGEVKNQEWVSPTVNTTADGSLYFSIMDLAKWDAALYTGKLLKRSSLNEMWTVARLSNGQPNSGHYGLGWFVEAKNGHRVVEHEGATAQSVGGRISAKAGFRPWYRSGGELSARIPDDEVAAYPTPSLARAAHGSHGDGQSRHAKAC